MNKKLISIIIPIYNGEKCLTNAIESAINQSYSNIEVICVDDGSTDNSYKLCQSYLYNPKVHLYKKENGRLASARNYGLKLAKGDFIQFLDCDDTLELDACSIAINQMNNGVDMVIYGFNIYQNKLLLRTPHCSEFLYQGDYEHFRKMVKLLPSACNKLYRKDYIKKYFEEQCVYAEDVIFNFENMTSTTKIKVIENCLYNVNLDNPLSVNKIYKSGRLRDTVRSIVLKYNKIKEFFGAPIAYRDYLPEAVATICFTTFLGAAKVKSFSIFKYEMQSVYLNTEFHNLFYIHNVKGIRIHHKIILFLIRKKALFLLYAIARILFKIRR